MTPEKGLTAEGSVLPIGNVAMLNVRFCNIKSRSQSVQGPVCINTVFGEIEKLRD
jgi:hypothetical protein